MSNGVCSDAGPQTGDRGDDRRGARSEIKRFGEWAPRNRAQSRPRGVFRRDQQVVPTLHDHRQTGMTGLSTGRAGCQQQPQQRDPGADRGAADGLFHELFGGQRRPFTGRDIERDQHRDPDPVIALTGQNLLQHNGFATAVPDQGSRGRGTAGILSVDPSERAEQPGRGVVDEHPDQVVGVHVRRHDDGQSAHN